MNHAALLAMAKKAGSKKIVKHNDLISVKMDLSLMQTRVFLATLAKINREDMDFKTYAIVVNDLLKECGVSSNNWNSTLKSEMEALSKISIKIPKENKNDFLFTSLFSSIEYISGQGILELSFDPKLKPYLLQVKGNFTTYALKYAIQMKSPYSIRMYELLKQYSTFGRRKFTLDFLREIFSLEDKYPDFYDFKKRVLEKARKDCEKYSDLTFTYTVIKEGRIPVGIDCIIKMKINATEEDTESETKSIPVTHSDFVQELIDANLSEERISEILDKHKEDYLKFVWEKCKAQNPKKLGGFFLKSLVDGYYEKNFSEMKGNQLLKEKNKEKISQIKQQENQEKAFDAEFFNQYVEAREQEWQPTLDDRSEFEAIMKEKIEQAPAFAIGYEEYTKTGMNTSFKDFLLRKYGKVYQYDKEAYKKYINQK